MAMTAPFLLDQSISLFFAVVLGFFFGLFLERGGLGNPHKLTGVFYLTDFTVPKVMFSAIVVAGAGLYFMADMKLLDMERIWFVPTFFWPQIAGGALFGIGFVLSGYCPGTAVAGLASGRLDALVTMAGFGAGSFVFAVLYPYLENFYNSSAMPGATLPKILNLNPWFIIVFLIFFAVAMFYVMEKYEKKD